MFSGFKFFCHGVKWSPDDIDAPVKTIVAPFLKTGNREEAEKEAPLQNRGGTVAKSGV